MVVSLCPVHPRNRTVVRNTFETFEDTLQPIYNIIQPTPFGAYYWVYWVYRYINHSILWYGDFHFYSICITGLHDAYWLNPSVAAGADQDMRLDFQSYKSSDLLPCFHRISPSRLQNCHAWNFNILSTIHLQHPTSIFQHFFTSFPIFFHENPSSTRPHGTMLRHGAASPQPRHAATRPVTLEPGTLGCAAGVGSAAQERWRCREGKCQGLSWLSHGNSGFTH